MMNDECRVIVSSLAINRARMDGWCKYVVNKNPAGYVVVLL